MSVEDDEVYPVHMLDDSKTLRTIVVTWTLCFNDVLDADKLHTSLSELLEIGDWKKIGGRLRLKKDGKLETHVPRQFTTERPAVTYTHQKLEMAVEDHPIAQNLPKATDAPSIHSGPQDFQTFAVREDAPATLEGFLSGDTPQLSLHITSFNNATIVGLSWPHTLMDVMGQQALLRGWSLVLAGKVSEVPTLLGGREDVICTVTDAPVGEKEEYALKQKQLKGWAMTMFGARFAMDLLVNRTVETRTVFLPKKTMADLRFQAQNDLAIDEKSGNKPFISEGDVLTAWAIRSVASSLPQPRPVTALHALNARFRLSPISQAQGVYVQNMAVAAFTLLPPEVATGPLGPIALENRQHLMEQATESQVLAGLRETRNGTINPSTMICGDSNALLMPFTNWSRADFFKIVDFSPAVLRAGEEGQSRNNPPGSIKFHCASSMRPSPTMRNVIVVLGKDHGDNYWLTGSLLPAAWAKIEEDLEKLR